MTGEKLDPKIETDVRGRLLLATRLVTTAGREALRIQKEEDLDVAYKGDGSADVVTKADFAVHGIIIPRWREKFPLDFIQSEEEDKRDTKPAVEPTGPFKMILDEIDGTAAFSSNMREWGVSLGILHDNQPVAGVVFFPAHNLTYTAVLGEGVMVNRKLITTPKLRQNLQFKDGAINLNYGYLRSRSDPRYNEDEQNTKIDQVIAEFYRRIGGECRSTMKSVCVTWDFCQLAEGVGAAASINTYIGAHDVAAAGLIIKEAGGDHTPIDWSKERQPFIAAVSTSYLEELKTRLGPDYLATIGF